ncbi:MAG: low affinity Fe/Cu permease [Crocinitomicaceae bacterium]|jgi:low affinity Fe/Cu permease
MKKAFELVLVFIIFYGVYSAFNKITSGFMPELSKFWVVIISLLVAAGLLLLYSGILVSRTKLKLTEKMTKTVVELEHKIHEKEVEIEHKDSELKNAFKIKHSVEEEAEKTLQN